MVNQEEWYPENHYKDVSLRDFMYQVYGWMSCALIITGGVAYYIAHTPYLYRILQQNYSLLFLLFFLQIILVVVLSQSLLRIRFFTALFLFILYAASVGVVFSTLFLVYTALSLHQTFFITASTFGIMSLYGYTTKQDLTYAGSLAIMGLLGVIIASLVNIFLQNSMTELVISCIGVVIFVVLTAADTQKIKAVGKRLSSQEETRKKIALLGALTLYLDFINLFLFLLRFMGKRRE